MDPYEHFQVEDFIKDERFVDWVLQTDSPQDDFWQRWMVHHPQQAENVARARAILQSIHIRPTAHQLFDADVDAFIAKFSEQTIVRTKNNKLITWLGAAAAMTLLTLGIWYWQKPGIPVAIEVVAKAPVVQKIVNDTENTRLIRLSDKSLVVLRPKSSLVFPSVFGAGNREVQLSGAAFFEVHRDTEHPFVVKAGNILTKVLGTSFDVMIKPDGESTVLVKTGKVQVFNMHIGNVSSIRDSVILLPNQTAVFTNKTARFTKATISRPAMLSPESANKIFFFTDAPLSDIVAKLQQAYGVNISYDEQKFRDYTVTASLSNLPLEEKIRAICKAIDAHYQFGENQIRIY
ncbi:putative anti-sigma factor [Pedobacter sp. BAL39]|uniref:FecR family protein n=1 Tax=Pedobacter sp. BAL39 TaxID=391596 RepID=UPI000155A5A6|nr:FecR family protein [Pedobacter sp. BAL39]EDM34204.1 putative anti-sigma factor [Pedobacter sp. BAL39]